MKTSKEMLDTHSVCNDQANSLYGSDERASVAVKLEKGPWKLLP